MSVVDPQREMAAAVLAQLKLSSALSPVVFDSVVDGSPKGWVVFYLQRLHNGPRLAGPPSQLDWLLTVHSVGEDVFEARAKSELVFAQLHGVRLPVDGWVSSPVRPDLSQPIDWDDTVSPPKAFLVDQFRWRSDRAA